MTVVPESLPAAPVSTNLPLGGKGLSVPCSEMITRSFDAAVLPDAKPVVAPGTASARIAVVAARMLTAPPGNVLFRADRLPDMASPLVLPKQAFGLHPSRLTLSQIKPSDGRGRGHVALLLVPETRVQTAKGSWPALRKVAANVQPVRPVLVIEQELSLEGLGLLGQRLEASGLPYRRLQLWREDLDGLSLDPPSGRV